jgi:transposase
MDRLPAAAVAQRFGYTPGYVRLLRHLFASGKLDFSEPIAAGKSARHRVDSATRAKIKELRGVHSLSSGEIAEVLNEDGIEISIRTVERVLREEGFPKLPRRTRLKIGLTVKGTKVPEKAHSVLLTELVGVEKSSAHAGLFLFAPYLAQFDLDGIVRSAGLPGSKAIEAKNYLLSFLALKLLGVERWSHANDWSFDPAPGWFAGLNILPKSTALSTYSYSLDEVHILRLQEAFVVEGRRLRLYDERFINLDFHSIPHHGDDAGLEKHWAGARGKAMKAILAMLAQDAESRLLLYTATDIRRVEANDQILAFLRFWKGIRKGPPPTLVFDSKFTDYTRLSELNKQGVKFITLRRRGEKLVEDTEENLEWKRIHIPHPKRAYPNPQVNESLISLRNYQGTVRQVIIRGNGREKPTFLITNDQDLPVELLVGNYARRWRVENGIAEAVKFFHLNSLSSPIPIKVHFDVVMTLVADTLYSMLARDLRGYEECNSQSIFRSFIQGAGVVRIAGQEVNVSYPRRAHNPILRQVPWGNKQMTVPGLMGSKLSLTFE